MSVGAGAQALSNVAAKDQALIAARLSPYASDGLARAAVLSLRPGKNELSFDTQLAIAPAREAFRREPLNTEAAAILSMTQKSQADRHMAVNSVTRLSRRGRVLNFAVLQDAMVQNDSQQSIAVLNKVLLVYPGFMPRLMPTLLTYLTDPSSIPQFRQILETNPVWADEFFSSSNISADALVNLGKLRLALGNRVKLDESTDRLLIARLVKTGKLPQALALREKLTGTRAGQEDYTIDWKAEYPPFDWTFVDKRKIFARRDVTAQSLRIKIAAGQGGVLASRIVRKPKDARVLSLSHSLSPASELNEVKLSATCATSTTKLLTSSFRKSSVTLNLGDGPCDWLVIAITGRAWSTGGAISGQIDALKFSQ